MTDTSISGPQTARMPRAKFRASPISRKGRLLAAALFGLVYAATLIVLIAPKSMIQGQPGSYVPPVMSRTITMPDGLPDLRQSGAAQSNLSPTAAGQ